MTTSHAHSPEVEPDASAPGYVRPVHADPACPRCDGVGVVREGGRGVACPTCRPRRPAAHPAPRASYHAVTHETQHGDPADYPGVRLSRSVRVF